MDLSDLPMISPLLDGFTLGAPISEHRGVKCCPAIKENTTKKYIVKIITVPASQAQFDALLLAGAYKDPGDAMEYFRGNGEDLLKEAELLKTLSKIEGFLPYEGWQMEPITRRRLGYEVYLVGSYKRSLEKYIRKNAVTHLEAVNLALDLCSALSVCRQSGFLYADLKPSNIYVSDKKEYRIGDLGFLRLDALRYASLPERYFSSYTPPELLDPMAPMNLTVDTYAVGMILYQLYNDGHLPFSGLVPEEPLPSPCHADYEMAEIIMKAIHPDPEQRWTDPKDLGKAIASYLQRNNINDIPITPFIPLDVTPEAIVPEAAEEARETVPVEAEPDLTETAIEPELREVPEEQSEPEAVVSEPETLEAEEEVLPDEAEPAEEPVEEVQPSSVEDPVLPEEPVQEQPVSMTDITEEVARIISKADDMISHEIPEEALFPVEEQQPDPFAFAKEDAEEEEDPFPEEPLMEETEPEPKKKKKAKHFEDPTRKNKFRKFISGCFRILIFCGICVGAFWYYQNIYLQPIDAISITGTQDQITVLVDTKIEESLLLAHCIDSKGKALTETVQGGKVTFSNLEPSTQYTIQMDMKGFHKLTGNSSDVFTTEATTQVLSFQAVAGPEDGSVQLDFTVQGNDPDFWNIRYAAEGEEQRQETVKTHSAMITGLTVGKVYTFTLDGGKNFDLSGETSLSYLATRLILAENLSLTTSEENEVTVQWQTPGDVVVESWDVRWYDGYGFEEQMTVAETSALLTGIEPSSSYTVEITAAGMTHPARIRISSDPISVSEILVDESAKTELNLTWDYTGVDPEEGWNLVYSVNGGSSQTIPCKKASAVVSPLIPGANYTFTLEAGESRTVFNNTLRYRTQDAETISEFNFHPENVSFKLLKTPEEPDWKAEDLAEEVFVNTFRSGDSVSLAIMSSEAFYLPGTTTKFLFVFRDSYGNVLPEYVTEEEHYWKNIWVGGDSRNGEMIIPSLPAIPGSYELELCCNGASMAKLDITVTE